MHYRIKHWDENYENSQSRKYNSISWVPIPNKQDGRKYRLLAKKDPYGSVFGVFILLVEIASKCPKRGVLQDADGHELTAFDFELMTGYPEETFQKALDILSDKSIGWLEVVGSQQSPTDTPVGDHSQHAPSALPPRYPERKKEQKEKKEQNNLSSVRTSNAIEGPPPERPPRHAADDLKPDPVPTKTAVAIAEPLPPQRAQDVLRPPKPDDPEYELKKEMHILAKQLDANREDPDSLKFEGTVLKIDHQTWQIWTSNLGLLPGQLAQACAILDAEMVPKKIRDPLAYASRILFQKSNEGSLHTWMQRCKPKNLDVSRFVRGQL